MQVVGSVCGAGFVLRPLHSFGQQWLYGAQSMYQYMARVLYYSEDMILLPIDTACPTKNSPRHLHSVSTVARHHIARCDISRERRRLVWLRTHSSLLPPPQGVNSIALLSTSFPGMRAKTFAVRVPLVQAAVHQ
eukprot:3792806-Amphidinium_carterae.2